MSFFSFVSQCCDANEYLEYGRVCAETSACYNDLRPMGAVLWFSLPYRLGLPPSVLILFNFILLAVSVALSFFAVQKLIRLKHSSPLQQKTFWLIDFGCICAHAVFLYPIIQTSLSDTPASLFALIAIWLLILTPAQKSSRLFFLGLAGFCLGVSAWIRAFFLYPLLIAIAVWFLYWLFNRQRKIMDLVLLIALIPPLLQVHETQKQTGYLSYLDSTTSNKMSTMHLNSLAAGYDTLLPSDGWFWSSSCKVSLLKAASTGNIDAIRCLLQGKLNFYLGSYAQVAYFPSVKHAPDDINLSEYHLLSDFTKNNNAEEAWKNTNMERKNTSVLVDGVQQNVTRITKYDTHASGETYQTLLFNAGYHYQIYFWLWSPQASQIIVLIIRNHDTQEVQVAHGYNFLILPPSYVSPGPEAAVIDADIKTIGLYDVVINSITIDTESLIGKKMARLNMKVNMAPFYTWGGGINQRLSKSPKTRVFSHWILFANYIAFIGTLLLLISLRKQLTVSIWIAVIFLGMVCVQALLIIPEQRFIVSPMIAAWVFFFAWIVILTSAKITESKTND